MRKFERMSHNPRAEAVNRLLSSEAEERKEKHKAFAMLLVTIGLLVVLSAYAMKGVMCG